MHQKKLALVNDVTGYGRCSIAVALPIVSALKVQGCILPTAILSVHTGFSDYYLDDYTDHMTPYIESWKKNGLTFDGISTGFLGSARQIDIVLDFLRDFKGPHTSLSSTPSWATMASCIRRIPRRCAMKCGVSCPMPT